jgi:hypothetical protein
VLEDGRARPERMRALGDVGELLGVAEQDDAARGLGDRDGIGQRDLARLVDEQDVDRAARVLARPVPRGRGVDEDGAVLLVGGGGALHPVARVVVVRAALLLPAAERRAGLVGRLLHRLQEVVDGLVRGGHHADPATTGDEVQREPRARPRLARAGRPLDHQGAVVEAADLRAQALELERLVAHGRRPRAQAGRAAQEQVRGRVELPARQEPAGGDPAGEAEEGVLLLLGPVGPSRPERDGRVVAPGLAAPHDDRPRGLVERLDPGAALGERLVHVPGAEREVLRGEPQGPPPRLAEVLRGLHLQPRDRLGILVAQLLQRALTAREERPEGGLGLPGVVAEQVERGPPRPLLVGVLGLVVGQPVEQALARRLGPLAHLPLARRRLPRRLGRERRQLDPELRLCLRAALEQPCVERAGAQAVVLVVAGDLVEVPSVPVLLVGLPAAHGADRAAQLGVAPEPKTGSSAFRP